MAIFTNKKHLPARYWLPLLCLFMCFYFAWHLFAGERSLVHAMFLKQDIQIAKQDLVLITENREQLEKKVVMMRPESLDQDLLEERIVHVLGYVGPNDKILLSTGK